MSSRYQLFSLAVLTSLALTLFVPLKVLADSAAGASDANVVDGEQKEKTVPPGLSKVVLASELTLRGEKAAASGQKQKAVIFLAAAAQLLDGVEPGNRNAEDVTVETDMPEDEQATTSGITFYTVLEQLSVEAADDATFRALAESLTTRERDRGLVASQGRNLKTVMINNIPFKILLKTKVLPGKYWDLSNVQFEGEKPAVVVVIGDGDGDLDLAVHDEKSGGLIGRDNDTTSRCVVQWVPRYTGPFKLHIHNVGRQWENFVVLANW